MASERLVSKPKSWTFQPEWPGRHLDSCHKRCCTSRTTTYVRQHDIVRWTLYVLYLTFTRYRMRRYNCSECALNTHAPPPPSHTLRLTNNIYWFKVSLVHGPLSDPMPAHSTKSARMERPIVVTVSDRHDPVVGVVALLPMFPDRGTKVGASPYESVMTASHVPNSTTTHLLPKGEGQLCECCRVLAFLSACEQLFANLWPVYIQFSS